MTFFKKMTKPSLSDWIKLSADGTIFETSRATLIGRGGLLAKMFDPRHGDYCPPPRDSNGAYLIDCNPQIFSNVLDMLRIKNCSSITKENVDAVRSAYYLFTGRILDYPDHLLRQ